MMAISENSFIYHKSFKKQEKEAGTDFVLLSRSRHMIG